MAIMYLSKENFTCPKELISLYLSLLEQFTLLKSVLNLINSVMILINWLLQKPADQDPHCLQCKM